MISLGGGDIDEGRIEEKRGEGWGCLVLCSGHGILWCGLVYERMNDRAKRYLDRTPFLAHLVSVNFSKGVHVKLVIAIAKAVVAMSLDEWKFII